MPVNIRLVPDVTVQKGTKVLEGFWHQIAKRITGKTARHGGEEGWEWLPEEEAIEVAGLCQMQEYVQRRKPIISD